MGVILIVVVFSLINAAVVTWYVNRWDRRRFDRIKNKHPVKHEVSDDYIAALRQAGAREGLIKALERERDRKR